MTEWVSDYNEHDEAYHWWLHVLTWPIEELKVYNLYYSSKLCLGKTQIYTTESDEVSGLESSLIAVWSQKRKEKIKWQKDRFGWNNKNLSIVEENEFKKLYLNSC